MTDTYTPPPMESRTLGGEVDLDEAADRSQNAAHTSDQPRGLAHVRRLARSLQDGSAGSNDEDLMAAVTLAVLDAQEQERSRLAEELHDGPAQALTNAIFQAQIVEHAVRNGHDTAATDLAVMRQTLERELETLRAYISQLRPSLNEPQDLDEALRDSAASMSARGGVPVEVSLHATSGLLPGPARTVALRVAQECLRNIAKHAGAKRAWLVTSDAIGTDGKHIWQMEVGDDGRGFDIDGVTAHPNRRHFGLRFMRERADLLGSDLSIKSVPAAGTVVRLSIQIGGERS